ncbi:uncharacterized protein LOC110859516 [Folsomia candida]|uniref:Uncharacterized protein n=1 Tax=Folsomia candida TaxID=158441 RepID=A0A226DBE9_FOLCA|nr:uncharacterized protein LOC110859516 [Folsomia candida]OXA42493.1 hypothetical protein Fcan01_22819 [Folsomia candida]
MANGPVVIKVVALVVLFVATVVGCHAHFNNAFKDAWDMDGYPELCKLVDTCPKSAMPMEKTFVALTIICLILSTISLVAGFLMDMKKFKGPDAGYHVLAGVLLFIAGILLIVAAVKIDEFILDGLDQLGGGGFGTSSSSISAEGKLLSSFTSPQMAKALPDEIKTEARKQLKFYNKLAGGSLAIIDGILYFVAAGLIAKQ